jgi:hypothetical protein
MNEILEKYQQGVQYISSEESEKIVELIEKEGTFFPFHGFELYRGVCIGEVHEIGEVITVSKNIFESWSEDENVAIEFSKERGSDVSAVYVLDEGEIKGLPLENYSGEMEWLLQAGEYIVDEVEDHEDYMKYYLKRRDENQR